MAGRTRPEIQSRICTGFVEYVVDAIDREKVPEIQQLIVVTAGPWASLCLRPRVRPYREQLPIPSSGAVPISFKGPPSNILETLEPTRLSPVALVCMHASSTSPFWCGSWRGDQVH